MSEAPRKAPIAPKSDTFQVAGNARKRSRRRLHSIPLGDRQELSSPVGWAPPTEVGQRSVG